MVIVDLSYGRCGHCMSLVEGVRFQHDRDRWLDLLLRSPSEAFSGQEHHHTGAKLISLQPLTNS